MDRHPVERRELSPQRVTYHAVTRYCQRVLDVHLQHEPSDPIANAAAHCRARGLTIEQVRALIWCPAVRMAVEMAMPLVGTRTFAAKMNNEGAVVTILPPLPRMTHKLKILSDREAAGQAARQQRRTRNNADRYLKPQKERQHD